MEQKLSFHIWMDVINVYFSIMFQPLLTFLGVTAKSSADFDPNVVLFDDKCKWLTLKWVWLKFSKAIHCVLDSFVLVQSLISHMYTKWCQIYAETKLTVFDLEKKSGWSLICHEMHTDRTRSGRSVNNPFKTLWSEFSVWRWIP